MWQGVLHGRAVGDWGACVAGETATAADDTHPTGMHFCYVVTFPVLPSKCIFPLKVFCRFGCPDKVDMDL